MKWSTHSRRIDPISGSAKPFCQSEAGTVGLSRMPMARNQTCDDAAEDPIPSADEVARWPIPGERLGYAATRKEAMAAFKAARERQP